MVTVCVLGGDRIILDIAIIHKQQFDLRPN